MASPGMPVARGGPRNVKQSDGRAPIAWRQSGGRCARCAASSKHAGASPSLAFWHDSTGHEIHGSWELETFRFRSRSSLDNAGEQRVHRHRLLAAPSPATLEHGRHLVRGDCEGCLRPGVRVNRGSRPDDQASHRHPYSRRAASSNSSAC